MNEIQTQVVDSKAISSLAFANQMIIATDDDCRQAIDIEKGLAALMKEIDTTFDPHIATAFQAHRGLVAEKKKHAEPVEEAKRIIKQKRIVYTEEQERIRKAEEARIQAEARRLIEEAALAAAIAAEEAGDGEEAEAIINEPIHVPTVTIQKTTPSAGIAGAIREIWSAEVYDLKALCNAVADGKANIGCVEANMTALNGIARSLKSNMQIPGVKAVSRKV